MGKKLTKQSKLVGKHPSSGIFFDWLDCDDKECTSDKKHRALKNKGIDEQKLIDHLSDWIIEHHMSPNLKHRLDAKKKILSKHHFKEYAEQRIPFPVVSDKTRKGNLGEIILGEYLTASSGLEILVYKLRYNPNIEQSMKGDDMLLFNRDDIKSKIIMGEAKFRKTRSKQALMDIIGSLSDSNLPISLTFVSERLFDSGLEDLSNEIDELISDIHKNKTSIVYTGFYHSDSRISETIEKNLKSNNENLIIISYGEDDPEKLINKSFIKAMEKVVQ